VAREEPAAGWLFKSRGRDRSRARCCGGRERADQREQAGAEGIWCGAAADDYARHACDLGEVNEVIGVAGFVVPGTRVDVVTIIAREAREDTISRVVVSNVQVLSAGTRYDQEEPKKDGKAIRSTVVTLMVSPVDAERVALAQAEGQLMLTLRNPLDVEPSVTPGVRKAALFASMPSSDTPQTSERSAPVRRAVRTAPQSPPAPVPAVQIYSVETIRAAKRTAETIAKP
jgi:pilus assembly protein CpaB